MKENHIIIKDNNIKKYNNNNKYFNLKKNMYIYININM